MNPPKMLIHAAMVADGAGVHAAPGAILIDGDRIVAADRPQAIGLSAEYQVLNLPDQSVIPALVNAHCHLDLSHIGPIAPSGDFTHWIETVRARRAASDDEIAASVKLGIAMSRAGGTAIIGDIAGTRSAVPLEVLRASGMAGVSYLEVFGLGRRQSAAVALLRQAVHQYPACENGVRFGVQPHAPYSCGMEVYCAAAALQRPLCTHLAETLQELTFVRDAEGPLADMIKRLGLWDDSITGSGLHPIDILAEILRETPCLAVHLNYIETSHLDIMSNWPITIAYCPRASAYFGHPQGNHPPHRYREMLEAGINVALGTDSVLCVPTSDRLSVLDEMRFLHHRDGTDPIALLRMGTVNGAHGLGFEPGLVTLKPGPSAGLLALPVDPMNSTDPLRQIMLSDHGPRWILGPVAANDSWISHQAVEAVTAK